MTSRTRPILAKISRLRQRRRRDGSWRVWWEAEKAVRELGFEPVELDPDRPSWSVRRCEQLNDEVGKARKLGARKAPARGGRTMAALIHDYRNSRHFLDRAAATRKTYNSLLNTIDTKWGAQPVGEFTMPVLDAWYDALLQSKSVRNSEAIIRMASTLFKHAERRGWRPKGSNPCLQLGLKSPKPRDRVLTWAETDKLIATAEELGWVSVALAIEFAVLQGQRELDILLITKDQIALRNLTHPVTGDAVRMWVLSLVRSKRQTEGAMPIHADLLPRLRRQIARLPADATRLMIDEATGNPYAKPARTAPDGFDVSLFLKRFAAVRRAASIDMPSLADVQFRDLRRTFGNRARMGGASRDDTGDVLGNSSARDFSLGDVYMGPQFWTAARAVEAVQRPRPISGDDDRRKA